jgi:hypothetical protein
MIKQYKKAGPYTPKQIIALSYLLIHYAPEYYKKSYPFAIPLDRKDKQDIL